MWRPLIPSVVALLLSLSACGGGGQASRPEAIGPGDAREAVGPRADAFVIVLENRSYRRVIGSEEAPFINRLARRGTLLTRYFGLTHPSLPNYLAILGGSTFGIQDDCDDCQAEDPSLPQQLSDAGISWRAYMEGMPEPCFSGDDLSGGYVKRHNPFLHFPSVASAQDLCDEVVPADRLASDVRSGTLPAFGWLTPNVCHDAHGCPIEAADEYLAGLVPTLLRHLDPHGFLLVTFDEGDDEDSSGPGGGHVATIVAGPSARHGARVSTTFDHYSLLRTLEDAFGLAPLREAASAPGLGAAFREGAVPSPDELRATAAPRSSRPAVRAIG